MGKHTFKGGVHPYDGKDISKSKPIQDLRPSGDYAFPVSQHIGAPATPIVAVGDYVLRGQKIAEAGGFVSSPVYSSVSGTVKAIEPRRNAVGDMVNAIIITNDEQYTEAEFSPCYDLSTLTREDVVNRIKEAGVVGMGGAGFPTHVKMSPKDPDAIDYIIANCAECEPYLTSDYRRMLEEPEILIEGMKIVLSIFPNAKGVFGIEKNKPDCIEKFRELLKDEYRIEVCALETKYPQGGERQMIKAVTGREINAKMLPADAGCIVDNCDTIHAIRMAVIEGRPLMERIFTVTGDAITDPRNFKVLMGCSYNDLIDAAGGFKTAPAKIISGGPMMGFALFDTDIPVVKTSSALTCFTVDEASKYETTACINCGRCVDACPEQLIPSRLSKFATNGNKADFEQWYGLECIECGSCSYVCPARKPLAQAVKTMKKQILADKRKK